MIENLDGFLILNKDRNECLEGHDMMNNSTVVGKRPWPSFRMHFVSRCRGNKLLAIHSIMAVPGVIVVCEWLEIRASF